MVTEPVQALLPGRHCLVVRLSCKEGRRPVLLEALNTYADGLSEEPGTEVFMVSLDPNDESLVWLFEVFKDEDAQIAHRSAAGFTRLVQAMSDHLTGPPAVLPMEPLRLVLHESVLAEDWAF